MPTSRCRPSAEARDPHRGGRREDHFVDATRLATALLGNSIGANIFMVGYAYQLGALPLSAESIEKAIELNGEAVR
jgi:indolepyruvate ferredoxin oxidoreductase